MQPHWQTDDVTLYHGDVLDVLAELPAESVHCVVTSPPYWGLRCYGVDGQLGLEKTPEEYVSRMVAVFEAVRRVLRRDGVLWLNLGDSYANAAPRGHFGDQGDTDTGAHGEKIPSRDWSCWSLKPKDLAGIPWRVAFALQAAGWWLRSDIIWAKPNPMPESVTDRPTKAHEYVFLMTKAARYYYDAEAIKEESIDPESHQGRSPRNPDAFTQTGGDYARTRYGFSAIPPGSLYPTRNRRSVWSIPTQAFPEAHFATFPEALAEPCILAGTSEYGACPACGAPWRRVVEREGGQSYATGKSAAKRSDGLATAFSGYDDGSSAPSFKTTGWRPGCECGESATVPCTVLDPFVGSGTTCAVARRLGCRSIGIDLSTEYLDMAKRRIQAVNPSLFATGLKADR